MAKNSENIQKVLPQTVERLSALEQLHNKGKLYGSTEEHVLPVYVTLATEFTKTLAQIEAVQAEITGSVHNNKALLQGVQESFAMNLDEINKTIISLDARIKALKK